MSECLLWNSETSCFRSAICGLSTAARVMVWLVPPPPPPAPEHAAPTPTSARPAITLRALDLTRWYGDRSFLSVMDRPSPLSTCATSRPRPRPCPPRHKHNLARSTTPPLSLHSALA